MEKNKLAFCFLLIVLFSASAYAQDNTTNATAVPSPTSTVSTTTSAATVSTPTATVSTPTPIATEKQFRLGPTVSLTSTKTTAEATSPAVLTLSMVNPIVNDVNLEVQPILKASSGVDITASSFAISGANQYTGKFIVRPGESSHVTIQITSDEIGSKTIESQIIYFPEGDKEDFHQLQQTMTIYIKEKPVAKPTPIPPEPTPPQPTQNRLPGFEAIIAVIGVLVSLYLVKRA